VLAPLGLIFGYLVYKGIGSINWAFLTNTPRPVGEAGGGMANAILGSTMILGLGSLIGVPLGIGAGIYMAEFGHGRYVTFVRFTADVLNGVPSIVVGIAVYALVVLPQQHFSALSGGVALGIMMIPTIARTTEEMLRMVPNTIREAALGLGIPRWRTTLQVTLRTASKGVITGAMLAFARVAGETAPLLFTAFGTHRSPAVADFCIRHFAVCRMASPSLGRSFNTDRLDRCCGLRSSLCNQPRKHAKQRLACKGAFIQWVLELK
jgi:phosphate transport system permease protein